MTELLYYSLILFVVFIIYSLLFKKSKNGFDSKPIPGPNRSLILGKLLGNIELFYTQKELIKRDPQITGWQVMNGLTVLFEKEGMCMAQLGPFQKVALLYRADTIEPLLSSSVHIEKSREYSFFEDWLGDGLLVSTGNKWRSRRKLLTPSFHFKILEDFVPVINGQLRQMMEIIDQKMNQNGIVEDVRPIITNCALDIICETAMGRTVHAQTQSDSEYVQSIRKVLVLFFKRFVSPWLYHRLAYRLSPLGREFRSAADVMHRFTDSVIKERKTEALLNKDNSSEEVDGSTGIGRKKKMAFLDALLSYHLKGQDLDEKDIRDEVDTFMFEGHDTTSSSLQYSILLLGLHPDVQDRIQEELDGIFGDDIERDITLEDLKQMKYLDQSVKESLRLYPPVPYVARVNREPLKVGEHVIPVNTTCLAMIHQLHRNPKVFPRPEVFDPSRFDPNTTTYNESNAYTYVPFSAGPRNCIGQKFALLEEKAVLAAILRKFRIQSLVTRDVIDHDITAILKPRSEIRVKFTKRF